MNRREVVVGLQQHLHLRRERDELRAQRRLRARARDEARDDGGSAPHLRHTWCARSAVHRAEGKVHGVGVHQG